jgi:hypothetical protein
MAAGMGILAGLLVVTFDFTPHRTTLMIILVALALISGALMFIAYKGEG